MLVRTIRVRNTWAEVAYVLIWYILVWVLIVLMSVLSERTN